MTMRVSFIVHGAVWPDALAVGRLRERLLAAAPDAQVLEAREDAHAPRGAAAAITRTATHAQGDLLVVLEPWATPEVDRLAALIARSTGPDTPRLAILMKQRLCSAPWSVT